MRGRITYLTKTGFMLVETDKSYWSIVEPLGLYAIGVENRIVGNFGELGVTTLYNISTDEEMEVCVLYTKLSKVTALGLIENYR